MASVSSEKRRQHRSSRDLIYHDNKNKNKNSDDDDDQFNDDNGEDEDDEMDESRRSKYSKGSSASRKSRRSLSSSRKHSSSRSLSGSRKSTHRSSSSSSSKNRDLHSPNATSSSRSVGSSANKRRSKRPSSATSGSSRRKINNYGVGDMGSPASSQSGSRNTASTFPISSLDPSSHANNNNDNNATVAMDQDTIVGENASTSNSSHLDADVDYIYQGNNNNNNNKHNNNKSKDRLSSNRNNKMRHSTSGSYADPKVVDGAGGRRKRSSSSKSGSRRNLKKESHRSSSKRHLTQGGSDQHTTASSTMEILYHHNDDEYDGDAKSKTSHKSSKKEKSHYKRASKPGAERVMDSPNKYHKSEANNRTESLTSDSSHSKNHNNNHLMISNHSKSSKRTNGTRSSKSILYGQDEDDDMKMKKQKSSRRNSPKRSSKPGVQHWYDNDYINDDDADDSYNYYNSRAREKNMLYGVEEEALKKYDTHNGRNNKRSKAHRPGIERVQGPRDLLYGEEEDKKMAMMHGRNFQSSSRAAVSNDGGYAYDFPVATEPRQAYSMGSGSLMVDSDIPADEPSVSAASISRSVDTSRSSKRPLGVKAGSVKLVEENKPNKKKRSTSCIICGILSALLVVVAGVVGVFVLLSGDDNEGSQALSSVNATTSPTDLVDILAPPPSADPSTSPTSAPTISLQFDPPSEKDCDDIANNRTLAGQEDLLRRDFTIKFDVTISNSGDISRGQVQELLDALERLFVPRMVGCSEVDIGRRRLGSVKQEQQQRRLQTNRYVIGNADVTFIENTDFTGQEDQDAECGADFTSDPERCHVVEVEMAVYLKGNVSDLFVITVISNVGKGNLVPPLELSDDFSEVYLSKADKGVTVQTGTPSVFPSDSPSTVPSNSPTDSPVVGPSPPPTPRPTSSPSKAPSPNPTVAATQEPTLSPTPVPTTSPSVGPTLSPVIGPSPPPSVSPTTEPSSVPSTVPTPPPTALASQLPTSDVSSGPTLVPTSAPTSNPTFDPTSAPTFGPTPSPTLSPTSSPTSQPTLASSAPPSEKCYCKASDACDGTVDPFTIGCDSCAATNACTTLTQATGGSLTVGEDSCTGSESCQGTSIHTIGDNSCTGNRSCKGRQVQVGDNSCTGEQACEIQLDRTELNFWDHLRMDLLTVDSNSCNETLSCFAFYGEIGIGSCTGMNACSERFRVIVGDNSCTGAESCTTDRPVNANPLLLPPNSIEVGNGSCQGALSCRCMESRVPDGECIGLGTCCLSNDPTAHNTTYFTPWEGFK